MQEETQILINGLRQFVNGAVKITDAYKEAAVNENDKLAIGAIDATELFADGVNRYLDDFEKDYQ